MYDIEDTLDRHVRSEDDRKLIKNCGIQGGDFPEKILDQSWRLRIVKRPVYVLDPLTKIRKEKDPPPTAEYISLGFDPTVESKVRHWRYFVKKELEKCPEVMTQSAFSTFTLTRGLSASLFKAKQSNVPELMEVGTFKGWVSIKKAVEEEEKQQGPLMENIRSLIKKQPEEEQEKIRPYLELYSMFKLDNMFRNIEKEIALRPKCIVRLYIIEAFSLSSRDLTSPSDPYLYIQLGDTVIDERDKHQDDTENPKFHSTYEFKVDLVEDPILNIKMYDYDYIGKDLIGETSINLDDRYYSPFWRALPEKPIEERSLYCEENETEQGKLRLWVDIFKAGEEKPVWNIIPQPDAVISF